MIRQILEATLHITLICFFDEQRITENKKYSANICIANFGQQGTDKIAEKKSSKLEVDLVNSVQHCFDAKRNKNHRLFEQKSFLFRRKPLLELKPECNECRLQNEISCEEVFFKTP